MSLALPLACEFKWFAYKKLTKICFKCGPRSRTYFNNHCVFVLIRLVSTSSVVYTAAVGRKFRVCLLVCYCQHC